jgi:hypothetical protein
VATVEQAAVAAVAARVRALDEDHDGWAPVPTDLDPATLVTLAAHLVRLTGAPGRQALSRLGLAVAGHAVRRTEGAQLTTPPKDEILARPGKVEQMLIDAQAAKMRLECKTYREIATAQGCSVSTAHERAIRAVRDSNRDDAAAVRDIEMARLDEMFRLVWDDLFTFHYKVDHGKIIVDADGNPVEDRAQINDAIKTLLKIQDRRAKYLGVDMPTRRTIAVITDEMLANELDEIRTTLAAKGIDVDAYLDANVLEEQ